MKNYGTKSEILLDEQLIDRSITQTIKMRNIFKKFDLDYHLPLKKTVELYHIIMVITFVFHKGNKYNPPIFLVECLCKL